MRASLALGTVKKRIRMCGRPAVPNISAMPTEIAETGSLISPPGAMIASVGWIAYSVLFAFYIDNFSNYAPLYGSLTAVILLMLWLYSCMYILFLGAEINLYYIRKIAVKNK